MEAEVHRWACREAVAYPKDMRTMRDNEDTTAYCQRHRRTWFEAHHIARMADMTGMYVLWISFRPVSLYNAFTSLLLIRRSRPHIRDLSLNLPNTSVQLTSNHHLLIRRQ